MAETRIELLEKLWQALKAWRNDPFNFTWRPIGEVIREMEELEKVSGEEQP